MTALTLYDYWRSSAAYRVRIALNVKELPYQSVPINLLKGEQQGEQYKALNPQGAVPMLVAGDQRITQSLAIIEYLEETHPMPALLPKGAEARAAARAMAMVVACDIHPIINPRVQKYVTDRLGHNEDEKIAWYAHWVSEGLRALETLVKQHGSTGRFCLGDAPTVADLCLIPQMYNARRFNVPVDGFPTLVAIDAHCSALPAFDKARPEKQPDAS